MTKTNKGFTLIELLVVLAIVAILSVVVILTLNPAELLKQARDSNRVSDFATLKSAISLYLADVSTPFIGTTTYCYVSAPSTIATATSTKCGFFTNTYTIVSTTAALGRNVNGTGWIPVNFSAISSGAPIGNLPVDPVNSATWFYAYAASSSLTFQLSTGLESAKYGSGSSSYMTNDGGGNNNAYETGTVAGLSM